MAIQAEIFSTSFGVRSFSSTKHIATKQHMAVWLKRVSDNEWTQLSVNKFELINNSAVLTEAPSASLYSQVEIRVADEPDELGASQSDIALVASVSNKLENIYDDLPAIENLNNISSEILNVNGFRAEIENVSNISPDILVVSDGWVDVQRVSVGMPNINKVANDLAIPSESNIITVANDISNVNTVANAINNNTGIGGSGSGGGQLLGASIIKGVQYMASVSAPNETITITAGLNAFSVDSFTLASGASIVVEDNATYKVL